LENAIQRTISFGHENQFSLNSSYFADLFITFKFFDGYEDFEHGINSVFNSPG
jgi:hypothetical protein